jgi:hypothetical protein
VYTVGRIDSLFASTLQSIKKEIWPSLSRKEKDLIEKVKLNLGTSRSSTIYVGSDLPNFEITITTPMMRWVYYRSLISAIDENNTTFQRKGLLDLYDKLFVYFDGNISLASILKLPQKTIDAFADTSSIFKSRYSGSIKFIFLHELGHFVKHGSQRLGEQRKELTAKYIKHGNDTSFQVSMDRMQDCFYYYQYEQGLEVEADAYALGKMLNTLHKNRGRKLSVPDISSVYEICKQTLDSYKYSKTGTILDLPKATCNIIIRELMMDYSHDSLIVEKTFPKYSYKRKIEMQKLSHVLNDTIYQVATLLMDLCEKPEGVFEKYLGILELDTMSAYTTWEYYTAFMQNYLARGLDDRSGYSDAERTIHKILRQSSGKSSFDENFQQGLKEYLLVTLAAINEFAFDNNIEAIKYYEQARNISMLVPEDYYSSTIDYLSSKQR